MRSEPSPVGRRLKHVRMCTFEGYTDAPEPSCGWQSLSQRELALFAGKSDGLVGHIERGETQAISAETAAKYCAILGITMDYLQTGEPPAHRWSQVGSHERRGLERELRDGLSVELINQAVCAARAAEAA